MLEVQLICRCCRQPYHPDKRWESEWDQIMLGAEKFAICAICGQSVPQKTFDDYGYRRRWLIAAKKHELASHK
ncbi:MAG TPA: hypothetical protein VFJ47_02640 [Terriglobales bacterium]|nr:hypothetical protein [Terriglobales bacterium]